MAPGPRHTAGPTETPPPLYTGRSGGGGRIRERELSPRDHMTCYVITRPCHPGGEGGDPPRHRSRDTRKIGGEMRVLGLLGPMSHLDSKYTWITHLFSVHAQQAHIQP